MADFKPLLVMGIGAGLKGTVTGFIRQYLPMDVGDDVLALAIGGVGYYFAYRQGWPDWVRQLFAGIFIAGVGGLVEGLISGTLSFAPPSGARQQNLLGRPAGGLPFMLKPPAGNIVIM